MTPSEKYIKKLGLIGSDINEIVSNNQSEEKENGRRSFLKRSIQNGAPNYCLIIPMNKVFKNSMKEKRRAWYLKLPKSVMALLYMPHVPRKNGRSIIFITGPMAAFPLNIPR